MDSFDHIWLLLFPQGEYKRRKEVCRRLWQGIGEKLGEEMQRDIWRTINQKMKQGFFVHPNPYFAIEDAKLELQRKARPHRPMSAQHPHLVLSRSKKTPKIRFFGKIFTFRGTLKSLSYYLCIVIQNPLKIHSKSSPPYPGKA